MHSCQFFTCIVGESGSGKSFWRTPVKILLEQLTLEDEDKRSRQRLYNEQPIAGFNPHQYARIVGSTSVTELLRHIHYNEGKHLLTVEEEIDTLTKGETAGSWSQKTEIYRKAFDNANTTQDYGSIDSFSTSVNIFYNILVSGTPGCVYEFFKDKSLENGLMNRWCFCQLKDRGFASAPDFKGFTPEEKLYMQSEAQRLMNCPTQINVESVRKAMKKWDKKIQEETSKSDDRIRFNLHKRAIIMGFRAGALCMVLEDHPRMAAKFATWVADYALDELMSLFGSKLKEQRRKMSLPIRNAKTASLFDSLNNEFTRRELIEARKKAGESVKTSSISTIIGRWQHSGFITDLGDDRFKKSL